ncbi:hypothetical protein BASA81_000776 [Batrachochytrium salamandrivorans]|nr:hypothetical protein BASA81_000776 [Batrachochytrium salamandrivorans]
MLHQAKFAFQAQNQEELNLQQGEVVTARPPASNGWILCENAQGKKGYVPETYVVPMAASQAPPPTRQAPKLPPAAAAAPTSTSAGVDFSSIPFTQTLGGWKERERKFLAGEAELLPLIRQRQYYYWDAQGNRQGPVSELEMKQRFTAMQVQKDTLIAPITTPQATEALPKAPVQSYFPDASKVFATAPTPMAATMAMGGSGLGNGEALWMYLDDQGEVQGPFASGQMRDWFLDSYFNAQTKVKLATRPGEVPFVPLGALFPGDGSDSFTSEGNQRAATAVTTSSNFAPPPAIQYQDPFATYPPPPAAFAGMVPPPPSDYTRSPSSSSRGRSLLNMAMSGSNAGPSRNPFESADYATPPPPAITSGSNNNDDWGVVWGDEEVGNSGCDAPVPEAPNAVDSTTKDTRKLAPYAFIVTNYLQNHDTTYHFLTRALQRDLGTVRCKIKRSIEGLLHLNYNRYDLYLEKDDGSLGPIIMTAIKYKLIGETMLTSMGTQFLLHNNVKMHSGVAKDLACVHYLSTGTEGGPRKITVAIPAFLPNNEQEFVEWPHKGSIKRSNLVMQIESLNFKNIQPLVNKPPVWSDKRHAWTLNFHGRVTRASVKNFQLCRPEDFDHVVLQHGRVGQDTFTMDVAWPMSLMQGLAVCLSSLHAKLGVE